MIRSRTNDETAVMNRQSDMEVRNRRPDTATEMDQQLEAAQAALLATHAPDTRVHRVPWSQGETQVLELGDDPPLLLIHGGGNGAFEWVPLLSALARNHRVVDVVANSMGGWWSVAFAIDAPERVSRLALVGAPAGVTRSVPHQLRLLGLPLIGKPLGRFLMSNPTRESIRKFWGEILVVHPEILDDTLLDANVAHMRWNIGSILSLMRCAIGVGGLKAHLILGKRWQALKVPTVFLWGERDAFTAPDVAEQIAEENPNLRVIRILGAGHLPWIDNPERVVDEIEHFLRS